LVIQKSGYLLPPLFFPSRPSLRKIGLRKHLAHLALAIEIEPFFAKEAKQRQQVRKGNQPGATVGLVPIVAKSRDRAASAVGLSGKTVSARV
jgi:hypothetical protein